MTITREDLELAAKAAGIEVVWKDNFGEVWAYPGRGAFENVETEKEWNPLTNKADRWDLAFRLGMLIDFLSGGVYIQFISPHRFTPDDEQSCAEAVVKAAAEIGRAKG